MIGKSKFDCATFGDEVFAVNAQRYTIDEAVTIFEQEFEREPMTRELASVIWKVGRNEDNEPCAGWWLSFEHDGTEPRYCPVWVFSIGG